MPQLKWTIVGFSAMAQAVRFLSTFALSPPFALALTIIALPSSSFATSGAYPSRIESPISTTLGSVGSVFGSCADVNWPSARQQQAIVRALIFISFILEAGKQTRQ